MSSKRAKLNRRQPEAADSMQNNIQVNQFTNSILPRAAELAAIEQLAPGSTQKIIDQFVQQSGHRRELEKFVIAGDSKRADRGQLFAFILGLVALLGGFSLIAIGKDAVGIASIIAAVTTLLGAFLSGAIMRRAERQGKRAKVAKKSF